MVGGTGLNPGVGHGKRLEDPINQPVVVELPQVAVVGMNNPLGIVGPLQAIQGSEFRLDGNAFIDGRHALSLSL